MAAALWTTGCTTPRSSSRPLPVLNPFTTDGCSLFPDGTFARKTLWLDCCIEHDEAYWQGGTEQERIDADLALKECITEETGDAHLAKLVYDAVRVWGSPIYPSWYRWGYGWSYGRPYGALTEAERGQVRRQLDAYNQGDPTVP